MMGDLNTLEFDKLKGLVLTLSELTDQPVHPFLWDAADVPSRATSVTSARNVRIDAIMFPEASVRLIDAPMLPIVPNTDPIPNAEHPSDHIPVSACFRLRTDYEHDLATGRAWFIAVAACVTQLMARQKEAAANSERLLTQDQLTRTRKKKLSSASKKNGASSLSDPLLEEIMMNGETSLHWQDMSMLQQEVDEAVKGVGGSAMANNRLLTPEDLDKAWVFIDRDAGDNLTLSKLQRGNKTFDLGFSRSLIGVMFRLLQKISEFRRIQNRPASANCIVGFEEFVVAYDMSLRVAPAAIDAPFLRSAFQTFDADSDGSLDSTELHMALERFSSVVDKEQCEIWVSEMDTNGDGRVDYEEFANRILRNNLTRSASFEELATTTTRRVHKCLLNAGSLLSYDSSA